MITLGQFIQSQKPGVSQDSYGYMVLNLMSLFDKSKPGDKLIDKGKAYDEIYQSPESFPEKYLDRYIYHFEPVKGETGRLFLRIILL